MIGERGYSGSAYHPVLQVRDEISRSAVPIDVKERIVARFKKVGNPIAQAVLVADATDNVQQVVYVRLM